MRRICALALLGGAAAAAVRRDRAQALEALFDDPSTVDHDCARLCRSLRCIHPAPSVTVELPDLERGLKAKVPGRGVSTWGDAPEPPYFTCERDCMGLLPELEIGRRRRCRRGARRLPRRPEHAPRDSGRACRACRTGTCGTASATPAARSTTSAAVPAGRAPSSSFCCCTRARGCASRSLRRTRAAQGRPRPVQPDVDAPRLRQAVHVRAAVRRVRGRSCAARVHVRRGRRPRGKASEWGRRRRVALLPARPPRPAAAPPTQMAPRGRASWQPPKPDSPKPLRTPTSG